MKLKTSISLIVAVALGLITTKVGWDLVSKYRVSRDDTGKTTRVVVAKRDLDPGYQIEAADLTYQAVPSENVQEAAFKDTKELVGRTLSTPVVNGQMMFEALLAPVGSTGGLQAMVPEGMRAVTVEVSESSGVAGLLVPGCHVDVISTMRKGDTSVARTIVENAEVKAVGPRMSRNNGSGDQTPARTITLVVTPKNAEAIELAGNTSKPRLVLRGSSDHAPAASPGVSLSELLGEVEPSARTAPTNNQAVAALAQANEKAAELASSQGDQTALAQILAAVNSLKAATQPSSKDALQNSFGRRGVEFIRNGKQDMIYYDVLPPIGKPAGVAAGSADASEAPAIQVPIRKGM